MPLVSCGVKTNLYHGYFCELIRRSNKEETSKLNKKYAANLLLVDLTCRKKYQIHSIECHQPENPMRTFQTNLPEQLKGHYLMYLWKS